MEIEHKIHPNQVIQNKNSQEKKIFVKILDNFFHRFFSNLFGHSTEYVFIRVLISIYCEPIESAWFSHLSNRKCSSSVNQTKSTSQHTSASSNFHLLAVGLVSCFVDV